jgi:hypothetical protein
MIAFNVFYFGFGRNPVVLKYQFPPWVRLFFEVHIVLITFWNKPNQWLFIRSQKFELWHVRVSCNPNKFSINLLNHVDQFIWNLWTLFKLFFGSSKVMSCDEKLVNKLVRDKLHHSPFIHYKWATSPRFFVLQMSMMIVSYWDWRRYWSSNGPMKVRSYTAPIAWPDMVWCRLPHFWGL